VVTDQFALRYGPPPGRGAVIFGMGSLGARRLTPTSDLDILVIYDAQGQEASDGKRSLPKRQYFARLTQALITAMTAPMSQGKLYEVDMRLRPSGNQGPVATSLASFESYQKNEAWTWEHLALTRARAVAGPEALREEIEALCDGVLSEKRERAAILAETAKMRLRIAAAKTPAGPLDAKIGPGRLQDIELFAQSGALLAGRAAHRIADGLETAEACGLVNAEERAELAEVYGFFWSLQCAGRLLSSHPLKLDTLGQAGSQFLCRVLSVDGPERLEDEVLRQQERADRIITSVYRDVYEEIAEGGDEGRSE
jgi:glutamate-ammonia-ligase adenylyltransferase